MLWTFRRISALLDARERRTAALLFVMMLFTGVLEALGVASVMPFIAVISTPEVVQENAYLRALYETFGFTSRESFLLFLGMGVFVLVVGSLAFKALTEWAMARYVHMRGYSLSCRLLRNYLARPYSYFLDHHSADLGKSVLMEVHQVVTGALLPAMQLVANVVVVLLLLVLVVNVEPQVALGALAVLGGAYLIIYLTVRSYLRHIGNERMLANRARFKIAQDALGGIKDVKVLGLEEGYMKTFHSPAFHYARTQASNQVIAQVPHFMLQGLAFGGIIVILLVLLASKGGEINETLPVLALYAFAGMRLLPALQQVYLAVTRLRYNAPVVEALYKDLLQTDDPLSPPRERVASLRLRNALELDHIDFSYPKVENRTLRDISLKIDANTTVGFVGPTGSGKTTIVDVILGLLEPQGGRLLVDGQPIGADNLRAWQNNIGYVPQHIFLTDDTVAANIAFGVPPEKIDMAAVERASRIAELHDFVVRELPDGYHTEIGERGVRLSGGQRQRIGIARALYHDPDVLIFDEATSALDNVTEKAVMSAIGNVAHSKTIILIAHRLGTVQSCDSIFLLDHGGVVAAGKYNDLLDNSSEFRKIANA